MKTIFLGLVVGGMVVVFLAHVEPPRPSASGGSPVTTESSSAQTTTQPAATAVLTPDDAFDLASRERQDAGAKAYHHPVGGLMIQSGGLPINMPNGPGIAQDIIQDLQKKGLYQELESKFPSLAMTNNHSFALTTTMTTCPRGDRYWVEITFQWGGYIRQGDPRKVVNYARDIILKEIDTRCSSFTGPDDDYSQLSWVAGDASETALITDLPNEPDTATGQRHLFPGNVPAIFLHPPQSVSTRLPDVPVRFAQIDP